MAASNLIQVARGGRRRRRASVIHSLTRGGEEMSERVFVRRRCQRVYFQVQQGLRLLLLLRRGGKRRGTQSDESCDWKEEGMVSKAALPPPPPPDEPSLPRSIAPSSVESLPREPRRRRRGRRTGREGGLSFGEHERAKETISCVEADRSRHRPFFLYFKI